jgi:hypothetical protein
VPVAAVQAAVHYLDLTVQLPATPPPPPAALALVRKVLDGCRCSCSPPAADIRLMPFWLSGKPIQSAVGLM